MLKVLIISASDLSADLGRTVLWRHDIERAFAPDIERAMAASSAGATGRGNPRRPGEVMAATKSSAVWGLRRRLVLRRRSCMKRA